MKEPRSPWDGCFTSAKKNTVSFQQNRQNRLKCGTEAASLPSQENITAWTTFATSIQDTLPCGFQRVVMSKRSIDQAGCDARAYRWSEAREVDVAEDDPSVAIACAAGKNLLKMKSRALTSVRRGLATPSWFSYPLHGRDANVSPASEYNRVHVVRLDLWASTRV